MTTEKIKYSIECLKLVTDEFDKNDIPYWLDYGTLLGAYRGSTLISYDYDMDIGVEIKYSDKIKSIIGMSLAMMMISGILSH